MGNVEADGYSVNGRQTNNAAASASQEKRRQKRREQDRRLISRLQRLRDVLTEIDSMLSELDEQIRILEKDLLKAEQLKQASFDQMHSIEDMLNVIEKDGLTDEHRKELKRILGDDAAGLTDAELLKLAKAGRDQAHQNGIKADIQVQQIRDELAKQNAVRDGLKQERDRIMQDNSLSMEEKVAFLEDLRQKTTNHDFYGGQRHQHDINDFSTSRAYHNENIDELSDADKAALEEEVTINLSPMA